MFSIQSDDGPGFFPAASSLRIEFVPAEPVTIKIKHGAESRFPAGPEASMTGALATGLKPEVMRSAGLNTAAAMRKLLAEILSHDREF